jgi:glutamate N-acetyltransferase/amino-acid N-acetyltransferase
MHMNSFKLINGGVNAPMGFKAAGVSAGIRKKDKRDLSLIFSQYPASAAGVFTLNKVKAAPLLLTMANLEAGKAQAVIINSGNANSCNGLQGMTDARRMVDLTGELLGIDPGLVVVSSTGVIGQPLPMDKIEQGIRMVSSALSESKDGGTAAAEGIITTDSILKETAVKINVGGKPITIGAMAKGSGMINPNMATMLCFITTDARVPAACLKDMLKKAVDKSFNMVTVDGDTSTNDMVVILANGASGAETLDYDHPDIQTFQTALNHVCIKLAKMIAGDGEGATKIVEVQVKGACSHADARIAACSIAGSNLVKTAVFGEDANWGRIITALGYSGAKFDPNMVDIFLGPVQVAQNGAGLAFDEITAKEALQGIEIVITVDLKNGETSATAWGCDLTYDYVRINASYRT